MFRAINFSLLMPTKYELKGETKAKKKTYTFLDCIHILSWVKFVNYQQEINTNYCIHQNFSPRFLERREDLPPCLRHRLYW